MPLANFGDSEVESALRHAATKGNVKTVHFLIEQGFRVKEDDIKYFDKNNPENNGELILQLLNFQYQIRISDDFIFYKFKDDEIDSNNSTFAKCKELAKEIEKSKLLGEQNLFDKHCHQMLSGGNAPIFKAWYSQMPAVKETNNVALLILMANANKHYGEECREKSYLEAANGFLQKAFKIDEKIFENDEVKNLQTSIIRIIDEIINEHHNSGCTLM